MRHVFDTGFFLHLLDGSGPWYVPVVWDEVRREEAVGIVSPVTLFELERIGLRGQAPRSRIQLLTENLPETTLVSPGLESLEDIRRISRLAHGESLSMADALILDAAVLHEAEEFYTTDSDFDTYQGSVKIVNLHTTSLHPRLGEGPAEA